MVTLYILPIYINILTISDRKYDWLGQRTLEREGRSWTDYISCGKLFHPSEKFQKILVQSEKEFLQFHGNTLNLENKPIKKFTQRLKNIFPNIPSDILNVFSRTRFYIRLKYLNRCLRVQEISTHKRYVNHVNKFK